MNFGRRPSSSQYIYLSLGGDHEFDVLKLGACSPPCLSQLAISSGHPDKF